ncbi:DTW-domain-containing protein [Basidiobolus meristosporus CBS 931.73]|uniref:tRNA-uridine aminocarboxypropyltransferase 1 n=1 Tax=Basidiobolus meristosporus CBS 931.73 TaxID=1314790 RepID=A0A1Y1XHI6_9FUNG|nr:DTW-domain-containing protein [Basidiobolus meristosporus CBS 931.73]|eukprot:ORX85218.1 DTW-domain-containing protein [Basidiobolus meristosporus CBS 931.73]
MKRSIPETFETLRLSDLSVLDACQTREKCPVCKKSVKYFCYRCFEVVGCSKDLIPNVNLPFKLDVIKHQAERDGKSTAIHAKIVAPQDVEIYTYPNELPDLTNLEDTLLLFPSKDAKPMSEIPRESFSRVIVVDGTWKQASSILHNTPEFEKVRKVKIPTQKTTFWRYQNCDETHLATIEAIYYLYKEYAVAHQSPYDGRYDDLLFYYIYFYSLIQNNYINGKDERSFTTRHQTNYIQYPAAAAAAEDPESEAHS